MPTYEYRCENCGKFEHIQKINDEPFKKCPKCGGKVQRLISRAGIVFKGSGFHVTDYGKEKKTESHPTKEIKSSSAESSPKK
ncbi:MAG: FmdB family zinc ribbon protein [Candidatus Margulisiibacteriota bacterium]